MWSGLFSDEMNTELAQQHSVRLCALMALSECAVQIYKGLNKGLENRIIKSADNTKTGGEQTREAPTE